jgi:hypothetical protein
MKSSAEVQATRLIRPLKSRLSRLLQELVRTNSVAVLAGADETPAQRVLASFFREQSIRPELYDTAFILDSNFPHVRRYKPYAGRKNAFDWRARGEVKACCSTDILTRYLQATASGRVHRGPGISPRGACTGAALST